MKLYDKLFSASWETHSSPWSRSQTHIQTFRVAPHPDLDPNCIVAPRVWVWKVWTWVAQWAAKVWTYRNLVAKRHAVSSLVWKVASCPSWPRGIDYWSRHLRDGPESCAFSASAWKVASCPTWRWIVFSNNKKSWIWNWALWHSIIIFFQDDLLLLWYVNFVLFSW